MSYVSLALIETQQSQSMTLNLRSGKGGIELPLASTMGIAGSVEAKL